MKKQLILLIILLLFSLSVEAQTKKKKAKQKEVYSLEVTGGYFYHGNISEYSDNSFNSIKTLQILYTKTKKDVKSGFSLGFQKQEYIPSKTNLDESRYALFFQYQQGHIIFKKTGATSIFFWVGLLGLFLTKGRYSQEYCCQILYI